MLRNCFMLDNKTFPWPFVRAANEHEMFLNAFDLNYSVAGTMEPRVSSP